MKKLLSLLVAITGLLLTIYQPLSAQEKKVANKVLYSEIGGPTSGFISVSANFDSRFKSNERLGLGYRLGAGFGIGEFYHREEHYRAAIAHGSFPVGLNYVIGKPYSNKTFEVGGGITLLTSEVTNYNRDEKPDNMIGFLTFMYRTMPVHGGFSFRIGFTPIIGMSGDVYPWGTIGFGYAF